jgi:hypothetical protein
LRPRRTWPRPMTGWRKSRPPGSTCRIDANVIRALGPRC